MKRSSWTQDDAARAARGSCCAPDTQSWDDDKTAPQLVRLLPGPVETAPEPTLKHRPRETWVTRRRVAVPEDDLAVPYLIVMSGVDAGRSYRLFEGVSILGRSRRECDVALEGDGVSRVHAELRLGPGGIATIRDADSTNGTFCNGQRGGELPISLSDGDKIQLGNSLVLKLRYQSALTATLQGEIYSSAVRDGLTEIFNRAYFDARLRKEFDHAVSHCSSLALLMFDLDHFKRVNDTYGHSAGDHVLKEICRLVEPNIREEDVFARYGGEEFVILMRVGLHGVLQAAERIRRCVAGSVISFEGRPIPVSVSVGVAVAPERGIKSPEMLLSKADQNLYRSKAAGRNQVSGPLPAST
jgi:two-component system, cell cycle response regulator